MQKTIIELLKSQNIPLSKLDSTIKVKINSKDYNYNIENIK